MSDDLVKRFDAVRLEYGAGLVSVEGAGVLGEVAARIKELEKERDRLKNMREVVAQAAQEEAVGLARMAEKAALARADALAALLREAEEALRPMVQHATDRCADDPAWTDRDVVTCIFSIPELRRAATLLARLEAREVSHDKEDGQ